MLGCLLLGLLILRTVARRYMYINPSLSLLLGYGAARSCRFIKNARVGRVHVVDRGSLGRLQCLIRFNLCQELAKVRALDLVQLESSARRLIRTSVRLVGLVAVFRPCEFTSGCLA